MRLALALRHNGGLATNHSLTPRIRVFETMGTSAEVIHRAYFVFALDTRSGETQPFRGSTVDEVARYFGSRHRVDPTHTLDPDAWE